TMGWGTSLWMNWKQKKRHDRSHAKSSPFRELLQILFYGNSAGGRALFFSWKTLRLLPILESGCHSNRQSCGNLLKCSAVGYV
ncbi:hypothetical protein, partial [Faecalibacterium prausnitzii]|uniref:hypothetical protein n=1 Tax=Faecalibacterium prausnitzii TaxID=853 RepID=UPI001FA7B33C